MKKEDEAAAPNGPSSEYQATRPVLVVKALDELSEGSDFDIPVFASSVLDLWIGACLDSGWDMDDFERFCRNLEVVFKYHYEEKSNKKEEL